MLVVINIFFVFRPLIQQKLDVLSEAGLNKENFSDLDTKRFKVQPFHTVNFVISNQSTISLNKTKYGGTEIENLHDYYRYTTATMNQH